MIAPSNVTEKASLKQTIPKLDISPIESNQEPPKKKSNKFLGVVKSQNDAISNSYNQDESVIKNTSILPTENNRSSIFNQGPNVNNDDFNFKFPDFYEMDFLDYENKKKENLLSPKKDNLSTNLNIDKEGDIDISELVSIMQRYNKYSLNDLNDFIIEKQLYQHRDEIFLGKIKIDSKETPCFIKCFSLTNEYEVSEAVREMKIYFKLLNIKNSEFSLTNIFINDFLYYFYDKPHNYFYVFYQFFQDSLTYYYVASDFNNSAKIAKNSILQKLLRFLVLLQTNGIIHRDLRFEYFTIDSSTKCPKIFDFADAFMLPDVFYTGINVDDERNMNLILDLHKDISIKKMFLTPKYVPPEITSESPKFGPFEDIWSFGCMVIELFINYSKYDEEEINPLLTRVFQGNQFNNKEHEKDGDIIIMDAVPKIPKCIEKSLALIIARCIEADYNARIFTDELIDQLNEYFKYAEVEKVSITEEERNKMEILFKVFSKVYKIYEDNEEQQEKANASLSKEESANQNNNSNSLIESKKIWYACSVHKDKAMNIFCEDCQEVVCENCYEDKHEGHRYTTLGGGNESNSNDLFNEKSNLRDFQFAIQKLELDKNFKVIENFCQNFQSDYENERDRIKESYESIKRKVNDLHKMQLKNLEASRLNFLESKFKKIFNESKKIGNLCKTFYATKNAFLSQYNRFNSSFINHEISSENFRLFKKKWEKFTENTEQLKINSNNLKEKCEGLRIPGKYIFRKELYTEDILKYLKTTESRLFTEKHKFFDYSKNTSLFLTQELLMIIPLTNTLFSYSKNSYKKFKVDFEKHKVKIHSFLPGCATLHQGNFFYITGGEIKDEATSSFTFMNISQKIIEESVEMNFTRRFHTMMSLETEHKKYICVIGGWDSKEVEMIETTDGIFGKWLILPSMNYSRSDPTTFLFNKKFIYVFGGWDYTFKKCVNDIERYEVFNDEGIKLTKQWETVKIRGDSSLLEKYNMGLINLSRNSSEDDNSEQIILVGGYDESYDYSTDVLKIQIMKNENFVTISKEDIGLPPGGESSFWYEKHFHYLKNDLDGEDIAVNFNCFNNIYVYNFQSRQFRQYANPNTKL